MSDARRDFRLEVEEIALQLSTHERTRRCHFKGQHTLLVLLANNHDLHIYVLEVDKITFTMLKV